MGLMMNPKCGQIWGAADVGAETAARAYLGSYGVACERHLISAWTIIHHQTGRTSIKFGRDNVMHDLAATISSSNACYLMDKKYGATLVQPCSPNTLSATPSR